MPSFFYFLFSLLLCCQIGYSQAISPFTSNLLVDNQRVIIDSQHHQILADTNSSYTIEEVANLHKNHFFDNTTQELGFSKDVKTWWLRFTLKNTNTDDIVFYLLTDDNNWAKTEFFFYDSTKHNTQKYWKKEQGGWAIPDNECHTDRVTETLPIELKAGEEKTIYVRKTVAYLQSRQDKGVVQQVVNKHFNDILTDEFIFLFIIESIFLGVIAMMTLYNLALFFSTKERSYFWYVWLIASFGISFSEEALYEIAADGGLFYYKFLDFLNAVAIIFSVLFTNTFLKTKQNFPFWYWTLGITIIIPLVKIILIFFDFISPSFRVLFLNNLFIPNTIIHLLLLLGVGIRGFWRKDEQAKLFLVSGSFLLFSMIVWNIHLLLVGEISTTTFWGFMIYLSPKISFIMMSLLFSRHLTQRINILRKTLFQEQLDREIEKKNIFAQQNTRLEHLVQLRTVEIEQQKEEIETQRDSLEEQNNKITKQNEDITASINAALRIQKAMLPLTNDIATVLPENFIFFRPRDIVSGDFYYFFSNHFELENVSQKENDNQFTARNQLRNDNFPITVLAAIDCTGHGVPGAFMSMIGNELLNEIVQTKHITEADQILNHLNAGVIRALQQSETENRDGMDMSLCVIKNIDNQVVIEYSGANNPLYYVESQFGNSQNSKQKFEKETVLYDNIFHEIKADKIAIGGNQKEEHKFTKHTIKSITSINSDSLTTFYLFSDGFQDQFGGEKGKKFMVKRLKELLTTIGHLPLSEQKEILESTLTSWQQGYEQVDDILVIGFRATNAKD